jgi:hypothetical protein
MLIYQDNQFWNGPDVEFATLAEAQANRTAVVDLAAASLRDRVTAGISAAEMSSWPLKLSEAQAGGGPMLTLEAGYRGISEADLIVKVLDKAQQLSTLEAQIAGVSGMHNDAINAMTTIEEVVNYDMRADWPEV